MRRTAVAVVVPALGIAAHGAASGTAPTPLALALCALVGAVVGYGAPALNRWGGLVGALAVGQALAHVALSVGGSDSHPPLAARGSVHAVPMHHMGAHADSGMRPGTQGFAMLREHLMTLAHPFSLDGSLMVLTHVAMIPVCAALIALAGTVAAAATAVVAVLRWYHRPSPAGAVAVIPGRVRTRRSRLDRAAGPGVRGPPPVLV